MRFALTISPAKTYTMKTLRLLSLSLLLALAGCQYDNYVYETPYDEPWRLPPKGTIVELMQPLTFSPGSSRIYIQDGVISNRGVNDYRPWCQFYLYESKEDMKQPRTIEPDEFTVVRASQNVKYVQLKPLTIAAVGIGVGSSYMFTRDEAGAQTLATTMKLTSSKQPQVHELMCAKSDDVLRHNFVSVNKIQATLGSIAQLHLPVAQ